MCVAMAREQRHPSYEGTKRTHSMEALSQADLAFFVALARGSDFGSGSLKRGL